ncbi:MAG: guanylate kinase [Clostridiales bacterium]|jgi:guanylate kinase|nr:guanylate kinase [Clostridiales bacterium]
MSKIFIIIGKSATGKDTIYKRLLEHKELNLQTVVMYTTRPIRVSEKEGVEYCFVDQARLNELKEEKRVIEHRSYNTVQGEWHYFTVNDGQIDLENKDYIMHGTLYSYGQIRDYFGRDKVVPVYIEVEDGNRLIRAILREQKQKEPKYAEVCRRFLADDEDFSEENISSYGISKRYVNNDIEDCIKDIISDIKELI